MSGLWGEEFEVEKSTEDVLNKINNPKEVKKSKKLSSKLSLEDRLAIIKQEVMKVLGKHINDVVLIKTKDELHNYFIKAIKNNLIGVDTETNKSLDPFTGKFVGFCFYTYDEKFAYVPINHVDLAGKRLDWQLTEEEVYEELQLLIDSKIRTVFSNGKFDYKFIKKVGERLLNKPLEIQVWWDTQIAGRLLDENAKRIGLKYQYIEHIDPTQAEYSIEGLFSDVDYEQVPPEIFALYAATDPYMSVKLYEWQLNQFKVLGLDKVFKLYQEVEMPVLQVTAEMELDGIELDLEYAKRLENKYTRVAEEYDNEVLDELNKYKDKIAKWRLTPDANHKDVKTNKKGEKVLSKSKSEQLEEPINLYSPTQLAILLYDVLECQQVNKKTPRSTDKHTLPLLAKQVPFINTFLKAKKMKTLLSVFIKKLPTMLGPDGRIHGEFNQLGNEEEGNEESVVTGRMCSSNPNLQQIPSKAKDIRMMFRASTTYKDVEIKDDCYKISVLDEVEIVNLQNDVDWRLAKELQIGDKLKLDKDFDVIRDVVIDNDFVYVYVATCAV